MRSRPQAPTSWCLDRSSGVRDYAVDPDQAARLWSLSAELTGINAFASV